MDERFREKANEYIDYNDDSDALVRKLKFWQHSPSPEFARLYDFARENKWLRSRVSESLDGWDEQVESGWYRQNVEIPGTRYFAENMFRRLIWCDPKTYDIGWAPPGLLEACKLARKGFEAVDKKVRKIPLDKEPPVTSRDFTEDVFPMLWALLGNDPFDFFQRCLFEDDVDDSQRLSKLLVRDGPNAASHPVEPETSAKPPVDTWAKPPVEPGPPSQTDATRTRILDFSTRQQRPPE